MKTILPYAALSFGAIGLISLIITAFVSSFCYVSMASFTIAVILFIICTYFGACCARKQIRES